MCGGLSADERGVHGGVRRASYRKGVRRRHSFQKGTPWDRQLCKPWGAEDRNVPESPLSPCGHSTLDSRASFGSDRVLGSQGPCWFGGGSRHLNPLVLGSQCPLAFLRPQIRLLPSDLPTLHLQPPLSLGPASQAQDPWILNSPSPSLPFPSDWQLRHLGSALGTVDAL